MFIVPLVLMTLNIRGNRVLIFFDSAVTTIITPFQSIITTSIKTVKNVWNNYFYLVDLKQENIRLTSDIEKLKEENSKYVEKDLKYQRLIKLLDLKRKLQKRTVSAEVVGVDPSNWSRIVFINKGKDDHIEEKMAVVTHEGLVGQVVQSTANASKVLLITDVRSAVDVLMQRSRSRGMAVGLNKDFCNIKYVPITVGVMVGERVVSSGLGGVFPKGLLVGFVKEVEKEKYGLFQRIELAPSADLSRLEEMLVITE